MSCESRARPADAAKNAVAKQQPTYASSTAMAKAKAKAKEPEEAEVRRAVVWLIARKVRTVMLKWRLRRRRESCGRRRQWLR
jgi:hypothetical protein